MKKIRDININYEQFGKGKDIVLLHGWGQNIGMMKPLVTELAKTHRITLVDLPGFGQSEEPKKLLTVHDYADIINELLKELKVNNPSLIGHSFGGKISIVYTSKYKVDKLVLFGSPCFASDVSKSLKVRFLKTIKKLPFVSKLSELAKRYIGSSDYKTASPVMREVLVSTVTTDVAGEATKIKAPTLIIWGDNDQAVALSDAKKLEEIIPDSALIVLEPGTHYAYLEHLVRVKAILKEFL